MNVCGFRLAAPRTFVFALRPDAARELDDLLRVWSTNLLGLSKGITRVRTTSLIRGCYPTEPENATSPDAAVAAAV